MIARLPNTNSEFVKPVVLSAFMGQEKPMTIKTRLLRTSLYAGVLLAILGSLLANPVFALSFSDIEVGFPDFSEFYTTVQSGDANVLRGVYVANVLAAPVVQQPGDNAGFVSPSDGVLTQFAMPSQFGNVGLLAHNYLSGKLFFELKIGQEVRLVYGDGRVETFVIDRILKYQALQPNSLYSNFQDLGTNQILTAEQVFRIAYTGDRHVTFQTCIAANGISSWGRIFVSATPKPVSEVAVIPRFDSR